MKRRRSLRNFIIRLSTRFLHLSLTTCLLFKLFYTGIFFITIVIIFRKLLMLIIFPHTNTLPYTIKKNDLTQRILDGTTFSQERERFKTHIKSTIGKKQQPD